MLNEKVNHQFVSKICLGLAAGSFAGILSLLQVSKLDTYLIIFLACFSILLPINLLLGLMSYGGDTEILDYRYVKYGKLAQLSVIFSSLIGFVGISCLILHFSLYIGIAFVIISFISFFVFTSKFK